MASRLELHEELCAILGNRNAYFKSPPSVQMKYDAIRYKLGGKHLKRANNKVYRSVNQYECVYITKNSDSTVPDEILAHFSMCSMGTPYDSDNLHHFPFTIYY